ncbi:AraC family transcriptional regulator [Clostridia bacterium]|nr:AraC family transcriptional regulator [Clostridia bacterium]
MDWLDRMNRAMDYIEGHLTESVDINQAAQMACCSTYHFQRMFSFITSVPLSEYVRHRRLTMAAFELQSTDAKVIDLAFKYGYESPEAFSRAFNKMHGVTPISARNKGVALKAYPRMSFHISIKGDSEMNYRIEEKAAFEVFGLELQTNVIDGQCYKDIPAFWESCEKDGRCVALAKAAGKNPNELLDAGVTYDHNPNGNMKYMIGCIKHPEANSTGYTLLSIPKQTWAVFSVVWTAADATDLHKTWQRIYSEWFPSASYEHADCDFDLELYFGDRDSNYGVEIWIPITKK